MLQRFRPSPSMVVACAALIVALGGSAYAVTALPKNSVGTKQLRRAAVTTQKLKNGAVSSSKLARTATAMPRGQAGGDLTGAYPRPRLARPEAWHEVGTAGQPAFLGSWSDAPAAETETVAFFKDRQGIVHLKGIATGGAGGTAIFRLPAGYRPAWEKQLDFAVPCGACGGAYVGRLTIAGPSSSGGNGDVIAPAQGVSLDGVTFRAAS